MQVPSNKLKTSPTKAPTWICRFPLSLWSIVKLVRTTRNGLSLPDAGYGVVEHCNLSFEFNVNAQVYRVSGPHVELRFFFIFMINVRLNLAFYGVFLFYIFIHMFRAWTLSVDSLSCALTSMLYDFLMANISRFLGAECDASETAIVGSSLIN